MKKLLHKLQLVANLVWQRPILQYLLFAVATIVSISIMGYYFGTFDQASHIPFLKKNVDPTLYQGDPFFDLRNTHYSYFWLFFIPFYRLHILEITMFIVYVGVVYLTFWAFWRLSKTLFNSPLTSFLSIIALSIPHLSFGMFPLIEFSLVNRNFVLPFLLIAIDLYLKKRLLLAFVILGLMYNLHVISVNFVLFMLVFDLFIRFRQVGLKKIILSMVFFIMAALPVLLWKFGHTQLDLSIKKEWFSAVNLGILFHLFNLISANLKTNLLTIGALGSVFIFFIARYYIRPFKYDRVISNFIYALILIILLEIITSAVLPITIIVESQIIRAGVFIVIFAYLYFIYYIVSFYEKHKLKEQSFIILLTASIFSIFPSILALIWMINQVIFKKLSGIWLRRIVGFALLLILLIFMYQGFLAYKLKVWQPGINISVLNTPYSDVEIWARNNTPKDAVFITPPYTWWFYNQEWRVISERSTVVVLSDLLEAAFAPDYIKVWQPRFNDIAPGAQAQFKGDYFENVKITSAAFYKLNTKDMERIANKYKASYLVVEKPHKYDFPIVYENNEYVVYRLKTIDDGI